jgi:hypothetical protein
VTQRPSRPTRLFETIILRPLSIVFLALAGVSLLKTAWVLGIAMAICWLLVGAIGQSLPHRKTQAFSELAGGSTSPPHDQVLSNEESFALAKAVMRAGAVVGFAALALAWEGGLRWYLVLICGFGGYFVMVMVGALLPALLGARKVTDGARTPQGGP